MRCWQERLCEAEEREEKEDEDGEEKVKEERERGEKNIFQRRERDGKRKESLPDQCSHRRERERRKKAPTHSLSLSLLGPS